MVANMLLLVLSLSGASSMCDVRPDLFISAPKSMEVLSGSCVRIPCRFRLQNKEEFDSSKTSFGVWIKRDSRFRKHPQNVIFNSSGTVKTYPMYITGNLGQKNCTTLFSNLTSVYTEKYFFRLENGDFKATASCNSTQITVKDSPPSPSIEVSHQQLKEKESVTITCSALTPCPHSPPKLTWNLQQDAANNMEENTDQTFTTKIRQIITVSDQHDGFNISCSAAYPVDGGRNKTAEKNITLSVSYAPKNTLASISPSGSLWAGMWVNLTCSSRAKPPVSKFTWFKTSTHGPISVSEGDVYSFSLTNDTEGDYYCEAINDLGKKKSSVIHVNIEDSPPSPSIEVSHQQLKEKESVTITCSALTPCPHSPPKLTWNLQPDAANKTEENTDRTFTTKIQQNITVSDQHDGFNISCSAAYPVDEGRIKAAETNITLSVSYAPKNTSASISPSGSLWAGMWVNLTCSSRAKPPVSNFTWFKTSTHGPIRVFEGDVYSFSLTSDPEGGYHCEATNDLGKQNSSVIHVNIEVKNSSLQWEAVLGGVIGIIIIICLAVCLWCLVLKRRPQKQTENQRLEELSDVSANKTEDEIQYGQIDFSKGQSGGSSPNGLDSGHQQETVYAQVKVSGAAQSLTHTGDGSEDLYAQVNKK
ncbi:B-cell receptor CD22-like [Sphaeramia orbicularis]|uniref:B-cell receptor CD22-like n=1 Tax=Sphaeramia orbicularis TaxID=375764 RepID=UPI00117CA2DE|nr:B-cell receptor CD22-like [Sphaeramia orbicularis]